MTTLASAVNLLQLLGEPTRVRLLALLAAEELTVAELTNITELGQSSVSTHLGKLREAGLLRDRRAGASTYYAINDAAMPASAKRIWGLVADEIDDRLLASDRARCVSVIDRREREAPWPDGLAGQMERHYSPGRTWEAAARGLVGLMRLGDVLDAGSGDGTIAALLAPRAKSIVCLDRSAAMIDAARARLAKNKNVTCRVGDVAELPFEDASFDEVLLFNVLTHVAHPARAIAEAARVLRPGGSLVVITLDAHESAEIAASYGEVALGFSPDKLRRMIQKAGLVPSLCDVTSREKRPPHFHVVTAFAHKNKK
jgi:ArsR family transcriptional regulator